MHGEILVVDDERSMCELLEAGLERRGYDVETRTSAEEALVAFREREFDVVVTDLNMRGTSGLELCERIVANRPDVPVVVITAFGSLESAIAAIRAGAYDFVTKPFEIDALALTLDRAVRHRRLSGELRRLREAADRAQGFDDILGESASMRALFDVMARVSETDATVLVTGESGTGKELVARAIHRRGRRASGPFVAVNCSAIPEALIESELFGHAKGAFTDARGSRTGLFAQADGGTLFLDEIGELPLSVQPKILRALQERKVRPVGANAEVPFDAQVIAATNRDLETEVEEGRFREDLYFRVNVIHLEVPPLRTRGTDVLLLADKLVEGIAARLGKQVRGLSEGVAERLLAYPWPGNVRELQNCIERAVALTRFERITVDDLPERIRAHKSTQILIEAEDPRQLVTLEEMERRYILQVLEAVGGNKTIAARTLGLDRKTLYRKLERYALGEKESAG